MLSCLLKINSIIANTPADGKFREVLKIKPQSQNLGVIFSQTDQKLTSLLCICPLATIKIVKAPRNRFSPPKFPDLIYCAI